MPTPSTLCSSRKDCLKSRHSEIWQHFILFRLKSPISKSCADKLGRQFIWRFTIDDPDVKCLAMLGCHDLDGFYDKVLRREIFTFNLTVNRIAEKTSSGQVTTEQHVDHFRIIKDGEQKFYSLKSKRKRKMTFSRILR